MPISFRASFTSVSLNGLMMASIFFHKLVLSAVNVRAFPMLRQIQTGMFFFRRDAQSNGGAYEFEEEKGGWGAESGGEQNADRLIFQLCPAAGQRNDGIAGFERGDAADRRFASTPTSSKPMVLPTPWTPEHVQRIIIA